MATYLCNYGQYRFFIRPERRMVLFYLGGYNKNNYIITELPEGFAWKGISELFSSGNEGKISDLERKLSEIADKIVGETKKNSYADN